MKSGSRYNRKFTKTPEAEKETRQRERQRHRENEYRAAKIEHPELSRREQRELARNNAYAVYRKNHNLPEPR